MRIKSNLLPLSKNFLQDVKSFCLEQIKSGHLIVCGGVSDILREDYVNESLPDDRASKHYNVSDENWRSQLWISCSPVASEILNGCDPEDLSVIYVWRAGLGFLKSFSSFGVKNNFHIGLSRNEKKPEKTAAIYLPLSPKMIKSKIKKYVIADIMLATGGSFETIIKPLLDSKKVEENKIILSCLIASPEGIYNLLKQYPAITIYVGAVDDHLDKNAYLVPGLGDAGDLFFQRLSSNYFKALGQFFNEDQWVMLEHKIALANPIIRVY